MVGSDRGGRPLVFATLIDERPHKNGARESVGRVGRRSALLYGTGELFACRHCYGLTYASQREPLYPRGLGKAQRSIQNSCVRLESRDRTGRRIA